MASGPVFIFCSLGLIFDGIAGIGSHSQVLRSRTHFFCGTEGVESRFLVLRVWTLFRRYRGCPHSFSTVPRASAPVFIFCAPKLIFGGTEGIRSRFHVLRSRTHFRRYQGDSGPIFMFYAPGHVFGGAECVRSHYHVLRVGTSFRRYRGRPVPFSFFALPDTFSCFHVLRSRDTEGVRSRFHVRRSRTSF
jgi:hypothetical protein